MLLNKYKNTENHGGKSLLICEKITKYKYTLYTKIGQCCYYMLLKIQKLKYTKILKIIVVLIFLLYVKAKKIKKKKYKYT